MILESKKIPFQSVDIAVQSEEKDKMREIVGNPKALPPQVCNGNNYCGVSINVVPLDCIIINCSELLILIRVFKVTNDLITR